MSGRKAAKDIRPGNMALSVGNPKLDLPNGWIWADLGEIATMATGHTPSRNHPEYWGGDIPWISVRDARPYHSKTINSTKENTNELGISNSAAVVLPKGTVCLSRTGSIGYSIILGREMATSQGFVNWICSTGLLARYLQLLFVAENSFLHSISEGVAHTTIYFPETKAFHIAFPPLAEQNRIVAKIEELFSELDKGIETLKTAQQQLKVYRQAVLKYAFEGKLTNPDVKEGELPEGWVMSTLSSECSFSQGIQVDVNLQDLELKNGCVRFLRIIDFTQGEDPPRYIKDPGERYHVSKDDVSLVRYGATTGFVCTGKEGVIANNLFQVIPKGDLQKKTLFYFLLSPFFQEVVSQNIKGAAMPAISFGLINDVPLNFPTSNYQQLKLVEEIESRLSVCDKIEESIEQGLQQAEALRQSILKKAFEGKLVPQDPNDEPASVLLERIKAERAAAQPEKKIRTKK